MYTFVSLYKLSHFDSQTKYFKLGNKKKKITTEHISDCKFTIFVVHILHVYGKHCISENIRYYIFTV